jgi:microcystin-dependent protein
MAEVPIGTVIAYAGKVNDTGAVVEIAPGWLLCNGAALSSQDPTYKPLHDRIKNAHGDGSDDPNPRTDFNLPDLRGLFLRGVAGTRTDRDPDAEDETKRHRNHPGGFTGNKVGSVQDDDLFRHHHEINDPGHSHQFDIAFNEHDGSGEPGQDNPRHRKPSGTKDAKTGITIRDFGGNETRPKNAYVYYIIRAR